MKRGRVADPNVWHVEMADANGDGSLEVVHISSGGGVTVRSRDGSVLDRHRAAGYLSRFPLCPYPGRSDPEHIVTCRHGVVEVLDFEAQIVARLDAPEAGDFSLARGIPGIPGTYVSASGLARVLPRAYNPCVLGVYSWRE